MAYSTALELYGALEQGRLDSKAFHASCKHLWNCVESMSAPDVEWFVDIDHVFAQSENEAALIAWVSSLSDAGSVGNSSEAGAWAIKGAITDGSLGVQSAGNRGITTSDNPGVYAELRASLQNFDGVGVRVEYVSDSPKVGKQTFSNVLWTGHRDLPYIFFTDLKPINRKTINEKRVRNLMDLAISTSHYSKVKSRGYVAAITRIILNNQNLDVERTIFMLSKARSVDGIELAGLLLIGRVHEKGLWTPDVSKALVEFPRLSSLCGRLQEKHAFPFGLVNKDAIRQFLSEVHMQWAKQADQKQTKKAAKSRNN